MRRKQIGRSSVKAHESVTGEDIVSMLLESIQISSLGVLLLPSGWRACCPKAPEIVHLAPHSSVLHAISVDSIQEKLPWLLLLLPNTNHQVSRRPGWAPYILPCSHADCGWARFSRGDKLVWRRGGYTVKWGTLLLGFPNSRLFWIYWNDTP